MEVAMFISMGRGVVRGLVAVVVFSLFIGLSGCADMMTYSARSEGEGMKSYHAQAYGEAAGAFRTAIREDPRAYQSQYYLAACYDEMKLHQEAFSQYRTALDVMRRTMAGREDVEFRQMAINGYAASVAKHDMGDTELNGLAQRAEKDRSAEEWFILAKVHRLKGDADSAIEAYRRATMWDEKDFLARKELGLYLLDPLNQPKEAEKYLKQAYQLKKDDPEVVAGLGRVGALPAAAVAKKAVAVAEGTVAAPRD
jgi:Tfp pilus assembly protein PilF